jgi:hypothetical protein
VPDRFIPRTQPERAAVHAALAALRPPAAAAAAYAALTARLGPAWRAAFDAAAAADARLDAARAALTAADDTFDAAARRWALTVVHPTEGDMDTEALRAALGGTTVSELTRAAAPEAVLIARGLLARVAAGAAGGPSPASAALEAATQQLELAWAVRQEALAAAGNASAALIAASDAFDDGWRLLVRIWRGVDGPLAVKAALPSF